MTPTRNDQGEENEHSKETGKIHAFESTTQGVDAKYSECEITGDRKESRAPSAATRASTGRISTTHWNLMAVLILSL